VELREDDLLRRAIAGDHQALKKLLDRHAPPIQRAMQRRIPRRFRSLLSAQDVMQDTYLDAFLGMGRFIPRRDGSFARWLRTIAERKLEDTIKALSAKKRGGDWSPIKPVSMDDRLARLLDQIYSTNETPSKDAGRKERCKILRQAIDRLPEKYRTVIEMHDLEGRSIEEVAAKLECSPGAVYMRRQRALRLLRRLIG
jgi:RNA polymerase sigma-70 factor (ECF subfamily)